MYQIKEGQWAYIFHRVSGLAIVAFLFAHIVENFMLLIGPEAYDATIANFDQPMFRIGEFALIAAVVYHAFNGLRIIVIDFWQPSSKYQKQMWYGVMAICVVILAWVAKILLWDHWIAEVIA